MHKAALATLGIALLVTSEAAAQVRAGPVELDFTGRAQMQMNTTSVDEDDLPGFRDLADLAFETRRVRFGAKLSFDEWITGIIEADFGGPGAILTDGYLDVELDPALVIRAGQFKKPFSLIELTSNTQILTIERSVRIRGLEDLVGVPGEEQWLVDASMYKGRDIGVMAHGAIGVLGYAAGVFNGSGANAREDRGSKAYAGRLTYAPAEPLTLGAAVSAQPTGSLEPLGDELTGIAWSLDAEYGEFRGDGLHVMAELVFGDDGLLAVAGDAPDMLGTQAVAAWFAPRPGRVEGIEPLLRVSYGDPDTDLDGDSGFLVTPGLNVYFTGRNRLMLNGDIYVPSQDGLDTEYALVAQLQVHF